MVPAMIPLLLIFIPAILMALGVVREKELGSITNLYVTPVSRLEFLLGKQLPYIAVSMISFFMLVAQAILIFDVPLKGSFAALACAALLYVASTTGLGLLISTFTRTQIAALFGAAILTMLPTVQFAGLTTPVTSLEGAGYWIGQFFPATYFLSDQSWRVHQGAWFFRSGRAICGAGVFVPLLTLASLALLRKQRK